MTTAATITQYYQHILQRDPTPIEITFWESQVDGGSRTLTQARDAIVTTEETVTNVDQIIRIYQAAFGRVPDTVGIDGWVNTLRDDPTALSRIADGFTNSVEFTNRYGGNTVNESYLIGLYQNVLGRTPSAQEIAAWIATGQNASQILTGFSNSAEFQTTSASAVIDLKTRAADAADQSTVYNGISALASTATGVSFVLLAGADDLTGTAGNDTFLSTQGTFDAADRLDGGAGYDILSLSNTDAITNVAASVANIEQLKISDNGQGTINIASYLASVTRVSYENSLVSDTTVSGVGSGFTVDVNMGVNVLQSKSLAISLATDGTSDVLNVNLTDVPAPALLAIRTGGAVYQTATLSLSANEAETLNIDLRDGTTDSTGVARLYLMTNDARSLVFSGDTSTSVSIQSDLQTKILTNINAGSMSDDIAILNLGTHLASSGAMIVLGAGNDTIYGGTSTGVDTITTGSGVDTVSYTNVAQSLEEAKDILTDFDISNDKIDLSAVTSDLKFVGTFNTLDFARSAGSFAGGAAVSFASDVNTLLVSGISGSDEMQIVLSGVSSLSSDNLIL